ncbi:MAG: AAA family ATPase [Anaerolineae bacterium]
MVWKAALEMPKRFGHSRPALQHFLLVLLDRYGPMAESIASGLRAREYYHQVQRSLQQGEVDWLEPEVLLEEAFQRAVRAGKPRASERDLAAVCLRRAGWTLLEEPSRITSRSPQKTEGGAEQRPDALEEELHRLLTGAAPEAQTGAAARGEYRPRARKPTPTLEQFGRDLCQEALDGKLPPILGRDLEIQSIMETLCRFTKRNPLLVGPAGVGKTAIVEGLAQRIVRGEVPPPLQGLRIFALQSSALVSGAGIVGELEKRMHAVLEEASQDGIVLFIDEIHTIVGSGGVRRVSDVGSLLKPALGKGQIACIGATTDEEFHQFIAQDRALERRFQPLRVQELSPQATLEILRALRERAIRERGITVSEEALQWAILLAQQYLRNRHFPDKAIDIFEQSVASALLRSQTEVTPDLVSEVVQRMIGLPLDLGLELSRRLDEVKRRLGAWAFCPEATAEQLIYRLEITLRGLDVAPSRPNGVVLVVGTPGQAPELAARVLAEALYGTPDRLIELDMTRFTHPADVNWLTGAPPGYVGHDAVLEFHRQLAQQPWSVVLFKHVDAAHPQAQEVLAEAFRSGFLTDAQGHKVYLSDTVVVMTANVEETAKRRIGFHADRDDREAGKVGPEVLPPLLPDLMDQVEISWQPEQPTAERLQTWLKEWVLPPLVERYQRQGLEVEWDPSVVDWLSAAILTAGDLTRGERLIEERVLPALIPYLGQPGKVILTYHQDKGIQTEYAKGA